MSTAPILQVLVARAKREGDKVRLTVRTHHDQAFGLEFSPALARAVGTDLRREAKAAAKPARRLPSPFAQRLPILKPCGRILSLALCFLVLAGCMMPPSTWRISDTPLENAAKRDLKETKARGDVVKGAQEAVHKAELALDRAGDERPVQVAREFNSEAKALLDQAAGAPSAGDSAQWRDLVNRLLSENAQVRTAAEAQRKADSQRMADLSTRLESAAVAREKAEAKVREYAAENERLADYIRKAVWIGGAIMGIWLLAQLLTIAARFSPGLGTAASLVNSVAAPAAQYALHRAQQLPERIGKFMAQVRAAGDGLADKITPLIDGVTDEDHQATISAAAAKASTSSPS